MPEPISVKLYDPETNEVKQTFTRSFIPWAILKRALRIQNTINMENLQESDMDDLAGLVVTVFGDQFSVEEASNGMDILEMITVLMAILNRAGNLAQALPGNPTKPGS